MKIAIAGAGILGRLLAFELMNASHEVTIFDKDSDKNCSAAAAGLLLPMTELEKNEVIIYQLGIDALNVHWPALLARLNHPVYFRKRGSLVFSHPQDKIEMLRYIQLISAKTIADHHKINHEEIIKLESELYKFNTGYFFPNEGQIHSQQVLAALKSELLAKQVRWHDQHVVIDHIKHEYDLIFDCRGLQAIDTFSELRSIRGELVWLHAPEVNITRPVRFLHPRYSLYIAPRPDHVYLVGASEIESDDDSDISVRTTLELLTAAYYVHAGFGDAKIIKTVTQRRPTLTNHLPKIKYSNHIIAMNGLYKHGYLIAPTLVAEVLRWLKHGISSLQYPTLWEKRHD